MGVCYSNYIIISAERVIASILPVHQGSQGLAIGKPLGI